MRHRAPGRSHLGRAAFALAAAWLGLAAASPPAPAAIADEDFAPWLATLADEARRRGISPATVDTAFTGVAPIEEILELDRKQPEKTVDFCGYMQQRLTPTRIARAEQLLETHADLLREITARYGVPARYLVALWGLESNFGDTAGSYPVIASLVTLAYDPRRSELFRAQIFGALRILEEGHVEPDAFLGSWAGATGQMQFMPTTFLAYAVDHDGDGRKDIWSNPADALATAANYLRRSGWRPGEIWGRPVKLPPELAADPASLGRARRVAAWQALGVRTDTGAGLPGADLRGSIVQPQRPRAPAFLVYQNYRTLLAWNRSTYFAISVGALADAVDGRSTLRACGL